MYNWYADARDDCHELEASLSADATVAAAAAPSNVGLP